MNRMSMNHIAMNPITVPLLGLLLGLGLACHSNPPVRGPDAATRCEQRPADENNCNACASQPACGWCEAPQAGHAQCQATADAASNCQGPLQRSTDECAAPQLPPGAVE
jgi:hypothetical protein